MAKVTLHDTPTQSIVKAATRATSAPDAKGRVIGIKKLQPLDRLRMFEVVGPENAKNEPYLGYAALAFHVASIDGEPVARPASKPQLEALIQRLGDEGMDAVSELVQQLFAETANTTDDVDAIKNSSSTPT